MSEKKKRRKWSVADKWRIVMTGIQPGCEISNLCCQEGINVTQLYNLLGSANDILISPREGLKSLNNAMKQNCNGSDWSSSRSRPKKLGSWAKEDYYKLPQKLQVSVHQDVHPCLASAMDVPTQPRVVRTASKSGIHGI